MPAICVRPRDKNGDDFSFRSFFRNGFLIDQNFDNIAIDSIFGQMFGNKNILRIKSWIIRLAQSQIREDAF